MAVGWCQQTQPNVSTACGGLDTGFYNVSGTSVELHYMLPENTVAMNLSYHFRNDYSAGDVDENVSVPSSCIGTNSVVRFFADNSTLIKNFTIDCYNGTGWQNLYIFDYGDCGGDGCDSYFGASFTTPPYETYDGDWSTRGDLIPDIGCSNNGGLCVYEMGAWFDIGDAPTPAVRPSTTNMIIGLLGLMIVIVLITLILRMDVTIKNLIAVMILAIIAIDVIIPYLLSAIGTVA